MGWWHWIVDALTGRKTEETSPKNQRSGGVAVLDAPDSEGPTADTDQTWWVPEEGLIDVVPIERPALNHEDRAFENLLISNFDGHNLTLPAMPATLERVLANLRGPDCEFGKIAEIIGEDQATTAAVLRLVNSPLYRGVNEITSLKLAITRLGAKAIRTLMMHQALRKSTFGRRNSLKPFAELVWKRSLASACIMRDLALFGGLDEEDAFLVGLLHDIGNVIVLRCAQDAHDLQHYKVPYEVFEYLCYECQQEFGELIAEQWSLPEAIKDMIVNHHEYPTEGDARRKMRLQLRLSDMINSMIGYGVEASYDILNSRVVEDLGVGGRPDFIRHLGELPHILDDHVESL